ncbi:hypothetical protein LEP1GSC050_0432 [Leptospira broomii serovar Hurstbridge str. 5399]|uniref:Uncharacterized protein n=1 Tax=Leptospira broomii serovar Hurstbridge str. 5399 TaxID=1049789 RepID=T0GLZ8_9LEPT|nr:hypothetical protein LEP1GSC050_0432 [Leptospira broomii serovar Hurstbridge str. 5399]
MDSTFQFFVQIIGFIFSIVALLYLKRLFSSKHLHDENEKPEGF